MIRVLHVLSSLGGGGVGKCLYNYYEKFDKSKITFDFIVFGDKVGILEEGILKMGSKIYHVTPKRKSYFKNRNEIKAIIKAGNYDIVHCHQDFHGAMTIKTASKLGVKNVIVHSHIAFVPETTVSRIRRKLSMQVIRRYATAFFACTSDAAQWLYGNELSKKAFVLRNAIDTDTFAYDCDVREKTRAALGVSENFVVGTVGRFVYQKNHEFLIDIFYELLKLKENATLLLAGDGPLEQEIKNKVNSLNISDKVKFLGVRSDVNALMQAMDVFLFPSRYEGLGIVAVEAQTSGLPCLMSDKVPADASVSENAAVLPLSATAEQWAQKTVALGEAQRHDCRGEVEAHGYNIFKEYKRLEDKYREMCEA